MKKIGFSDVTIRDGFWKTKQDMVKKNTVYAIYDRLIETHRFEALQCTWKEGEPNQPHIYWDSDVAKWLEGVAFILEKENNEELKALADAAIDTIIKNSDENGYFNSHFSVVRPDEIFCHRDAHELYCAGHLIEAAVAYYKATGKDRFLKAMCKFADYIEKVFKIEGGAKFITPGHPELELALVKLYEVTGEERYFSLAAFFIDAHGKNPETEMQTLPVNRRPLYNMDDIPLADRQTIDGHCVRALYLYSGAADVARIRGDNALRDSCKRIFENTTNKRMYITGGVGPTRFGEAFTIDYELPNRTAYAETCAAIALAFFASRMQLLETDARYADCVERAMYNGIISGISMDGKAFFYENPLEMDPEFNDADVSIETGRRYAVPQRQAIFNTFCCPPNVLRFISSIGGYIYTYDAETVYIHQYMDSVVDCDGISIEQSTNYPADGAVKLRCKTNGRKIAVRIPGWCRSFTIDTAYEMKNGYAVISAAEAEICISFDMPVTAIRANRRVHDNAGRIAFMRGPVVYCAEGIDNGADIKNIRIDRNAEFKIGDSMFLLPSLHTTAYQLPESEQLYAVAEDDWMKIPLTLIPYYAFANRGASEMNVWLLER